MDVPHNPNITPVKGETLTRYSLKKKKIKNRYRFSDPIYSTLTLNLIKIKKHTSRPPMTLKLIFPESTLIDLMFRLKIHPKTRRHQQFTHPSIRPNFPVRNYFLESQPKP